MVSKVAFGVQDFVGRREGKGRKIVGPRFKGLGWSDQFWVLGSGFWVLAVLSKKFKIQKRDAVQLQCRVVLLEVRGAENFACERSLSGSSVAAAATIAMPPASSLQHPASTHTNQHPASSIQHPTSSIPAAPKACKSHQKHPPYLPPAAAKALSNPPHPSPLLPSYARTSIICISEKKKTCGDFL